MSHSADSCKHFSRCRHVCVHTQSGGCSVTQAARCSITLPCQQQAGLVLAGMYAQETAAGPSQTPGIAACCSHPAVQHTHTTHQTCLDLAPGALHPWAQPPSISATSLSPAVRKHKNRGWCGIVPERSSPVLGTAFQHWCHKPGPYTAKENKPMAQDCDA
eukprot:1157243-Pelagomonas_calceolata.AAC.11